MALPRSASDGYPSIALYRPTPLPYLGDVVLTGTPDAGDNVAELSHPQAFALIDLYLDMVTVGLMPRHRS
ncbi:hypothetical protein [Streptomyces sp. NBC_00557]|uniref:hypothetical protein n=1 Tax=Streptomyces sp. NBC_00557 TaxID=2975776 RepID=UPI002E8188B7|nr:hypothetical protein [Streptomyces sp. NBC_00557]WUC40135.1 hypothetical protein OG956_38835 [Streptomyces sp. NBC_00557]